jgi:hypothetical protein
MPKQSSRTFVEILAMSPERMSEFGSQCGDPAAALRAEHAKAEWSRARFAERESLADLGHQIIELAAI